MAAAIFRPLNARDRMQARWSDGRATSAVAADFIKPNDRLTSFERLEIYNRVYWFRFSIVSTTTTPGCARSWAKKNS
jgi:hypothetical protein